MNAYTIPFRETEDDVLARVFNKIKLRPGDVFVDIGCGNGLVLEQVKALHPDVECIGIEIDPVYHAQACARLISLPGTRVLRADLRNFDWNTLPFFPNPPGCTVYYYVAWTKTYVNEFDFKKLPAPGTLIVFKHKIPGMLYTDTLPSTYPFNHVYVYSLHYSMRK